jgi:hypothetical protein
MVNFFQSQIEILCSCVELECIDIIIDVSMLSIYLCLPYEDHLYGVLCVCAYLAKHHNVMVVFDPA